MAAAILSPTPIDRNSAAAMAPTRAADYVTCSTCGNLFPAPAHHDANSECLCCAEIASLNTRIDDMVERLVTASDSMCGRIFGVMAALQDRIDRLVVLRAAQV